MVTRVELFSRSRGLRPTEWARRASLARMQLLRLRDAETLPTRRSLLALLRAGEEITGEAISADVLFERGEEFLRGTHLQMRRLFAAELARLDEALDRASPDHVADLVASVMPVASETVVAHLLRAGRASLDRAPQMAAGIYSASHTLASSLAASQPELVAALKAEALKGRANAFRHIGAFEEAMADLASAARLFAAARYCGHEAGRVQLTIATVEISRDEWDAAARAAAAAREQFLVAGDARSAAHAEMIDAAILFQRGDTENAVAIYHRLRRAFEVFRDRDALTRVWANLGACEIQRGNAEFARPWLMRASAGFRSAGNTVELTRVVWSMGHYLARFSKVSRGVRLLERVERIFGALQMYVEEASVGLDILDLQADDRNIDAAVLLERGVRVATVMMRVGMRVSAASALHHLRTIRTRQDARLAVEEARALLRQAAFWGVEADGAVGFEREPS